MSNPAIPRDEVHTLAEACGNDQAGHAPTATRIMKDQRRLTRYFEQNAGVLGLVPAQVALYMLTVCVRIFEQKGGRLSKVTTDDLDRATTKVQNAAGALMPADKGFASRARAVEDRAQAHILDEVLWALYDRTDAEKKDSEAELTPEQSAMIYLLLWSAVEALDACWKMPAKA